MAPEVKKKRQTNAQVRRETLFEVRASIRADILLDNEMTPAQTLDRLTKTLDVMIEKVQ